MNASLMKRLFKAINETDSKSLRQLADVIIEDEKKKGHEALAKQLDNILDSTVVSNNLGIVPNNTHSNMSEKRTLINLPMDRRYNQPLATMIPRNELEHHMVLPNDVEQRFVTVEKEFTARDRLAKFGLKHRKKILLYGAPGCGKTLGAQRLAWNTGLPLLKVRFDSILSSYLGESAVNLRTLFESVAENPCLLLLDECDFIARSRDSGQDVGEMPRIVNSLLQLLDEFNGSGLIVATTNLQGSLDKALFRRFDDAFELPKPGEGQISKLVKMTLSLMKISNNVDWNQIVGQLEGFSAAEIVKIAENSAKECILQGNDTVTFENLVNVISQTKNYENMR
ncbi:AAA family ATPase [Paenibacillus sp. FA6]|uniref:AAA family ATPase n=1 Tax=Paenibacillus sp. FA6 TaxID=3413029 RepID=UPI003F65ABC6